MKINVNSRLYMKKPVLVFFVLSCSLAFMLLLGSCLTLLAGQPPANQANNSAPQPETEPPENKPEDLGWRLGQFTNEWGDKTGDYFMTFDKSVTGSASGNNAGSGRLRVSDISISELQGLTFRLDKRSYDSWSGADEVGKASVVLRYGNNEEITIEGKRVRIYELGIELSDELVNILSREETINFRITNVDIRYSTLNLTSYYQFDLKLDNFNKAYEQLKMYSKN